MGEPTNKFLPKISGMDLTGDFTGFVDGKGNPFAKLEGLSRINLFVGSNNSGKSRFLRKISLTRTYKIYAGRTPWNKARRVLQNHVQSLREAAFNMNVGVINGVEFFKTLNKIKNLNEIAEFDENLYNSLEEIFSLVASTNTDSNINIVEGLRTAIHKDTFIAEPVERIKQALAELQNTTVTLTVKPQRFYIPILRGLRPLDEVYTDYYKNRTKLDYDKSETVDFGWSKGDIYTGQSLYQDLIKMLLGSRENRLQVAQYEEFLRNTLFDGREVELIPREDEPKTVHVRLGNEIEYPIHELGDGIQSLIILTFKAHITQNSALFFIEEPELHLHPGLQRQLVETIVNKFQRHVFFMTTHSNHILDMTADVDNMTVYRFTKTKGPKNEQEEKSLFVVQQVDGANSSSLQILADLGVRTSSVFLVNATIWVEGIYDNASC